MGCLRRCVFQYRRNADHVDSRIFQQRLECKAIVSINSRACAASGVDVDSHAVRQSGKRIAWMQDQRGHRRLASSPRAHWHRHRQRQCHRHRTPQDDHNPASLPSPRSCWSDLHTGARGRPPPAQRTHTGRWHSRRLRSSAGFETVQTRHFGSLAFTPLAGGPSGRRAAPPFTTSTTAWNKPRCTTRFSSTPRPSPPKPKTLPAPTCRRTPKGRVRHLPRMRHPNPRLPALAPAHALQ